MSDSQTKLLGVIGYPVSHSKSPAIHTVWLSRRGINAQYLAFEVAPETLPQAILGLQALGAMGCNITVPHKEAALALCDVLDPAAKAIGAVNTLVFRQGKIHGYNTDWSGFLGGLPQNISASLSTSPRPVVIFGAGGAARGVAYALSTVMNVPVIIMNRTRQRADDLIHALNLDHGGVADINAPLPPDAQMVINTLSDTSVVPNLGPLPPDCFLYDLSYKPAVTPFLAAGQARGLSGINGAAMLAHQGAAAFELWFGLLPAVDGEVLDLIG